MAVVSIVKHSKLSEYFGRFDAEFYKPSSLNADTLIKGKNHKSLGSLVEDGYRVVYENTKILNRSQANEKSDSRFLQATNISTDGLWIEINDVGFVGGKDWDRYPKGRIKHGELLIEVKGQAEKVTIVQDYIPERTLVTGTLFKLTLKQNQLSHEYVYAFLNSKYGKILRDRTKVNTLISYVSKPELYKIPIFIPKNVDHDRITSLVKLCFRKQIESKYLYKQANQLLEQELGLDKIEFKKDKSYRASFSEILGFNRSDAEFFNVKFNPYLEKISRYHKDVSRLSSISTRVLANFKKSNCKSSSIYYVEIGDINISDGSIDFKEIGIKEVPENAKIKIKGCELVLSMVRPTRGAIALFPENLPSDFVVTSGAFYVFNVKNEYFREIVWLYLRIVKDAFEKYCTGTSYPTIEPYYFSNFPVPNFDEKLAIEIRDIIKESIKCKNESKQLLEQAKAEVETLIEQATN